MTGAYSHFCIAVSLLCVMKEKDEEKEIFMFLDLKKSWKYFQILFNKQKISTCGSIHILLVLILYLH